MAYDVLEGIVARKNRDGNVSDSRKDFDKIRFRPIGEHSIQVNGPVEYEYHQDYFHHENGIGDDDERQQHTLVLEQSSEEPYGSDQHDNDAQTDQQKVCDIQEPSGHGIVRLEIGHDDNF